jgi:uncharacterized protein
VSRRLQVALLDVNVIVALAWPNHVRHAAAHKWFGDESENGWATTPITEAGFVRVSSNRRALPTATTPALALEMLGRLSALPGHTFWPDALQGLIGKEIAAEQLVGHRRVTDAHLLALCLAHDGRLVTFDQAIPTLIPDDPERVLVLRLAD